MSPQEFGVGVVKGSKSLVSNTAEGLTKAAASITSSAGNGLALLSFDPKFARDRQAMGREVGLMPASGSKLTLHEQAPKDAKHGFQLGMSRLLHGLKSGVTGVIQKPVSGAKRWETPPHWLRTLIPVAAVAWWAW